MTTICSQSYRLCSLQSGVISVLPTFSLLDLLLRRTDRRKYKKSREPFLKPQLASKIHPCSATEKFEQKPVKNSTNRIFAAFSAQNYTLLCLATKTADAKLTKIPAILGRKSIAQRVLG